MYIKRIIFSALALGVALGSHAQEVRTERFAGQQPTDVQQSVYRYEMPVEDGSSDSLVNVRSLEVRTYIDTLRTVTLREDVTVTPGDSAYRIGHYVEVHLGAGIGNVGYGFLRKDLNFSNFANSTAAGDEHAGLSGAVQIQYAYFFHKNVGIGVGAWLSNYTSHGHISGELVFGGEKVIDTDGEAYGHHADIRRWHERQTIHTVGVPISLQVQAWGKRNKAGFFMSLGAAPAYIVKANYNVLDGEIEHWGLYRGNAELHELHEYGVTDYKGTNGKLNLRQFTATGFIDLGLLVRMSAHTDLLLGVYGHYTVMDVQQDTKTAPRVDIGWHEDKFSRLEMERYQGILATKCLDNYGALHPWQAGVKIGVHWHSIEKPHTTTVLLSDTTLQMVVRSDSVWSEHIDTFPRTRAIEMIQRKIDTLNRVYFAFDSHLLSEESMHYLQQIAEELKAIPNKVIIAGHASKEGTHAHNARLAHYRALMVKYYLVDCGIPAKRMIVKDYGSSVPNAINLHGDLSLDRRVEIIVQDE
ncbi:MAG: OmpA family protein [Paludibacteraceae bacterium]|nr:OmpA family protein [Paludibacteraceae bacterium]